MKNIRIPYIKVCFPLIIVVILGLSFTGCEVTQLGNASGIVLNADTGNGMSGAVAELYRLGSGTLYATSSTDSQGYYRFNAISVGVYELTARRNGYVFTREVVEITWSDDKTNGLPNVAGFLNNGSTDLKIVALWDNDYMDVDAYLTLPNENSSEYISDAVSFSHFTSGGDLYTDFNVPLYPTPGFCPEFPGDLGTDETSSVIDRIQLHNQNSFYGFPGKDIAEMEYDCRDGGGPETISIYNPVDNGSTTISYSSTGSNDPSSLPAADYAFTGVLEYYLSAFNATNPYASSADNSLLSSASGYASADPRVFIFSGSSLVGYYVLPQSTNIKDASIFRINCFYNISSGYGYYQIIPDIALAWAPRSIEGTGPFNDRAIVTVPARNRRTK